MYTCEYRCNVLVIHVWCLRIAYTTIAYLNSVYINMPVLTGYAAIFEDMFGTLLRCASSLEQTSYINTDGIVDILDAHSQFRA